MNIPFTCKQVRNMMNDKSSKGLFNKYENRQQRNHVDKPIKTPNSRTQRIDVFLDKKGNYIKYKNLPSAIILGKVAKESMRTIIHN